ncbi:hypothetical protein BXZ70DRAFT_694967 [Cristinia sonorae]|uniref:ABM domain-containing protein n=1 Tax=Cristinia sonorae TaxID=1940300 RepID=A0A8K0XKD5_9AGAR|nr:hypothetical protein BXZ70DRAFT_694967 [Cristinia sonorae]
MKTSTSRFYTPIFKFIMSSTVVVELATFPATEAYKADPTVIHPALEIISKAKGARNIYHGLQYEDKATAYLVIIWDSLEDHHALLSDKDIYPKIMEGFATSIGGPHNLVHVAFKPLVAPIAHLTAPISEFAVQTLKEGKTNADLEGFVWNPAVTGDGSQVVVGKVVEKEDQYVLLKGWESYEAHQNARNGNDENVKKFITYLHTVVDTSVAHVPLKEYKA